MTAEGRNAPDLGDERVDRGLAVAFATPVPGGVAESVVREIERRAAVIDTPAPEAGRYRVFGEIGRGGIGVVFESHDRDLDRDVALKVLRADRVESGKVVRHFVEEAQIGGQLEHPGIVPVYDLGLVPDGTPYFAMKLVRGRPLSDLLARREHPSHHLRRFLGIFEQVCLTVAYAHARGVVHSDLKPANVMVGTFGEVQVVDWGLARVLGRHGAGEGEILGTPGYMSPEQARGEEVDERSDVFALGATLLEILTGAPPFPGDPRAAVVATGKGMLEEAHGRLDDSPAEKAVAALCRRCLSAERGDRPRKADEVAQAVTEHLADLEERARRAEIAAVEERAQTEAAEARERRERQRVLWERRARRRTMASAAAVLIAILSGAGLFVTKARGDRAREERAATEVAEAMDETRRLEGEGRLEEAEAEAGAAIVQARVAGADEESLVRVTALHDRLHQAVAEAQAAARRAAEDAAFIEALRAVRTERNVEEGFRPERLDEVYAATFRAHGIDADALTPQELAVAITDREPLTEIVVALDEWALTRRQLPDVEDQNWRRLLDAARIADPDPWRNRLRGEAIARNREALLDLAATARVEELSPATIVLLAKLLRNEMEERAAADLLLRARERYPGDLWINDQLGVALKPPRHKAAVRYAMAAAARHPDWPSLLANLGNALGRAGNPKAALRIHRRCLEIEPDRVVHHMNVAWTLTRLGDWEGADRETRRVLELEPGHLQARVNLAIGLLVAGEAETALGEVGKMLAAAPRHAPALSTRGNILKALGRLDDAEESFRQAVRAAPRDAVGYLMLGRILGERGRREEAIEVYLEGLEVDPYAADVWYNLGNCHAHAGEFEQALSAYRRAAEIQPDCHMTQSNLGMVLYSLGQYEAAIEHCRRALEIEPSYAPAHNNLALALDELDRTDEAIAEYRRATELDPELFDAWHNLGAALLYVKKIDDAIEVLEMAVSLNPKAADSWYLLGVMYCDHRQDLDKAIERFQQAVRLSPQRAFFHGGLGLACRKKGRLEDAVSAYRRASELQPGHPRPWFDLGEALERSGKHGEAIRALRKALELDARHIRARTLLAWLLADAQDTPLREPNEAVELAGETTRLAPRFPRAWFVLGVAQYRTGRFEAARDALATSEELGGVGDASPWLFLAMVHAKLGDKDEARSWYARAVSHMEEHAVDDASLVRYRAEAEALLTSDGKEK